MKTKRRDKTPWALWAVAAFAPQIFLIPGLATVGAAVAARTGNRAGWLFIAIALVLATTAAIFEYAVWPVPPGLPGALLVNV